MTVVTLDDWIPLRIYPEDGEWKVDWIRPAAPAGHHPRDVIFYDFWLESQLQRPFNLLFRRQTGVDALLETAESRPGLSLAGMILHMSRCGSTLAARMLATNPDNLVLIEPYLLQRIMLPLATDPLMPDELRIAWLRALVSVMGRPLRDGEQRLFLKLGSLAALRTDLLVAAFPEVPWVFMCRRPVEVLLSQLRLPAGGSLPGYLDPRLLGVDEESMVAMPLESYIARLLAQFCANAIDALPGSRGMVLDYARLPEAAWSELAGHFGLTLDATQVSAMQAAARFSAKGKPGELFRPDTTEKQKSASPELHALAEEIIDPCYRRLEAISAV